MTNERIDINSEEPIQIEDAVIVNIRTFTKKGIFILSIISLAMALFHIYTGGIRPLTASLQRGVHLNFALILVFLYNPISKKHTENKWGLYIDIFLCLMATISIWYYVIIEPQLFFRYGNPNTLDIIMSTIGIILVLEAARRTVGTIFVGIVFAFILYAYFGPYMPGFLKHQGMDYSWLVSHLYLSKEGIFGSSLAVSANFVYLFVLFGGVLQFSGGGQVFIDLSIALLGKVRGGPAKVAIIASALMGMISGSPVANVASTGALTIPLMNKVGYKRNFSGAVVAVASSGGAITPPVMGAAAFLMADFLRVPYVDILKAAIIPSIIFYIAIFFIVDAEASRLDLKGLPESEIPPLKKALIEASYKLFPPIFVLMYVLVGLRYSAQKAAFWSIATSLIIYVLEQAYHSIKKKEKLDYKTIAKEFVEMLRTSSAGALTVICACAAAGLIIGVITSTGIGLKLSSSLVQLAGGKLLLLAVFAMLSSIILGMGIPITACYIIVSILAAPALIEVGVTPMAAHLFVLYYGVLSGITPPVALASYVAAGIAGGDNMKTSVESFRVGLIAFLLPYFWLYNPAMLGNGSFFEIAQIIFTATIGAYCFAGALQGFYLNKKATLFERVILLIVGFLLVSPGSMTDIAGLISFSVVMIFALYKNKTNKLDLA